MSNIQFRPIEDPYVHGEYAERNFRTVEVVRAYPGDWRVFGKIKGYIIKICPQIKETYATREEAMKDARRFLRGDFTPDTWQPGQGR